MMHQKMAGDAGAGDRRDPRHAEGGARSRTTPTRPRWPMIVLRSPKGWTGPKEIDGHKVEGSWRSHQVPFADVRDNPAHLKLLEDWMRSYKPEELFDEQGALVPELAALAPRGTRRMSANPHANGGAAAQGAASCPTSATTPSTSPARGTTLHENTKPLGEFLRDVMREQPDELPRVRPGRDRLQPAAGDLRGEQEDLDGRPACRRTPTAASSRATAA